MDPETMESGRTLEEAFDNVVVLEPRSSYPKMACPLPTKMERNYPVIRNENLDKD
jgi:hypothetical protein